jgi:hypothetical protein
MKLQFEVYNKQGAVYAFFLTGPKALTQARSYIPGFKADGCQVVVRRLN